MMLLGPDLNEASKATLKTTCEEYKYDLNALKSGVWMNLSEDDKYFFSRISKKPGAVVVHDIGDFQNTSLVFEGSSYHLIVSSPNAEKLRRLYQYPHLQRVYMPHWSLEELRIARAACYPENVDVVTMEARFKRMDGIPRYVIEAKPKVSEDMQELQLKNVRMEAIQTIFTTTDFTALPTQAVKDARNVHDPANSTDLVFKEVPNAKYDDFTCQFSSEYVSSALARRFAMNEEVEVMSFARALQNRPILASFRGDFLECRALRIF